MVSTIKIAPRPLSTPAGLGDRFRVSAFAELQAREAFRWAESTFSNHPDASVSLRRIWRALALAEDRHLQWLLQRMDALGVAIQERPVSDQLWRSLIGCLHPADFCHYMANAESWGKRAAERFAEALSGRDPQSAKIFRLIAQEEQAHIAVAHQYFPHYQKTH